MKTSLASQRMPRRRIAGNTLATVMIAIVLTGIIAYKTWPELQKMLDIGHNTAAQQLEDQLNGWYRSWTSAGGQHNATPASDGQMAATLLTLAFQTPIDNDPGTKSGPDSYGNTTDETKIRIKGVSAAASSRLSTTKPWSYDATNDWVVFDSTLAVRFHATSANTGTFTVTKLP